VEGKECVFFANFSGLRGHENAVQRPERGAVIKVSGHAQREASFLPFLGAMQKLQGIREGSDTVFELPVIEKGAVACLEPR
jgi:hypothetical protein